MHVEPNRFAPSAVCGRPSQSGNLKADAASVRSAQVLLTLLACAIALIFCMLAPVQAQAKSYECPKVSITAQAQTDGSLHIVEQRTFVFDGEFTAVWWTFSDLPYNAELSVESVRMAPVDESGAVTGEWVALENVTFQSAWRTSGGPGRDAFSLDKQQNTVYAFFDLTDTRTVIEVDLTVENGVMAYDDVAEIYWKYVPEGWGVDSQNVTASIALPVPSGVEVQPGSNVRAWGHGPLDGTVSVNADGTVEYEVPLVKSGQYAEARVVFPVKWLTNLTKEAAQAYTGTRLDTVLAEESAWADTVNSQRMNALAVVAGMVLVSVVVLLAALLLWLRFGRELKPDFTGDYWRDVPDPDLSPALVGRLWRWNRESTDDFSATVLQLAHEGVLRVEPGVYQGAFGGPVQDYYLTRVPEKTVEVSDPVSRKTLEVLFDCIAGGADALWLGSIREYGIKEPRRYADAIRTWQAVLSAEVDKQDFFSPIGFRLRKIMTVAGVLLAVGGVLAAFIMGTFVPALTLTVAGAVLVVIGNYMPRRTERGNNVCARAKALRNWLRDYGRADERVLDDASVGGKLMVYAYLFGVADQVVEALKGKVPAAGEGKGGYDYAACVPWWAWYATYSAAGASAHSGAATAATAAPIESFATMLDTSVHNTYTDAQAAVSAVNAQMSGASGAGGGFSAGGGGGFGGGGGAR